MRAGGFVAIQGVPVDTIEIESFSCKSSTEAPAALPAAAAAGGVVSPSAGEPGDAEQRSAEVLDTAIVRLLLGQMRAKGARVDLLVDPASVNRSWIRRGRVFWFQQRCLVKSAGRGSDAVTKLAATAEDNCRQQLQECVSESDVDQRLEAPILGGVLSYHTTHPVQLRFGFRRACYILRRDSSCREVGMAGGAGGFEGREATTAEAVAATEGDRLAVLAEIWLAGTTSV